MPIIKLNSATIESIEFQERSIVIYFTFDLSEKFGKDLITKAKLKNAFILGKKFGTNDIPRTKAIIQFLKDKEHISEDEYLRLLQEQALHPEEKLPKPKQTTPAGPAQETKAESRKPTLQSSLFLSPIFKDNIDDEHKDVVDRITKLMTRYKVRCKSLEDHLKEKQYALALLDICKKIHNPDVALQLAKLLLKANNTLKSNLFNTTRDAQGSSALHHAARNDHRELFELLVDHGADKTLKDAFGNTPEFYFNPRIRESILYFGL